MNYPKLTIIIVTRNSERTITQCLQYIKAQTYPALDEILLVDGGSTDATFSIAQKIKLPIKIIDGGFPENQEARRAVGIAHARNNFCSFLDTDNYITDKNWLTDMVRPLLEHEDVVASQTLRYSAPKNTTLFNRYFGLLGAADPVAFYMRKSDRLSWLYYSWNLQGTIVEDNKQYYIVDFDPKRLPTVGCNGIVFKKNILIKAKWKQPSDYIHTDVFVDIAVLGYTKFAIVKNEIFHNTAENISTFFKKRLHYMQTYHQTLYKKRRHLIFDARQPRDIISLGLFLVYALTLIEPIIRSIRGYVKKRDIAWFLHPIVCIGIAGVYGYAVGSQILEKSRKR